MSMTSQFDGFFSKLKELTIVSKTDNNQVEYLFFRLSFREFVNITRISYLKLAKMIIKSTTVFSWEMILKKFWRMWRNICARVGFFSWQILVFNQQFSIFYIILKWCSFDLKFEKIFYQGSFFVKLWGFKDCQFGTTNARVLKTFHFLQRKLQQIFKQTLRHRH